MNIHKTRRSSRNQSSARKYLLPAVYLAFSLMLMVLPLEGVVVSFKAVLAYIFVPQVRVAHGITTYASDVSEVVRELLDTHRENRRLKQEIEMNQLLVSQAQKVFEENERLTDALQLSANHRWNGVWAKVAYREPTQWNIVTIDKGAHDGITERSAVISVEQGKEGLAGVVVEVMDRTAKVLLLRDEDFSAAVYLEHGKEGGLLVGDGPRPVRIKYIPLEAKVNEGDNVYTSSSSSVFPEGILVGTVSKVLQDDSFKTALVVQVEPAVRPSSVKEVFVIADEENK